MAGSADRAAQSVDKHPPCGQTLPRRRNALSRLYAGTRPGKPEGKPLAALPEAGCLRLDDEVAVDLAKLEPSLFDRIGNERLQER
ncbi:hypothetical protein [Sinorhizobium medicae]